MKKWLKQMWCWWKGGHQGFISANGTLFTCGDCGAITPFVSKKEPQRVTIEHRAEMWRLWRTGKYTKAAISRRVGVSSSVVCDTINMNRHS